MMAATAPVLEKRRVRAASKASSMGPASLWGGACDPTGSLARSRCGLRALGAPPGGIGDCFARAVHAGEGGGGYGLVPCGGVPGGLGA